MTHKTALHTYLALMGNQRIPHLEEEIFADDEATTLYLHNLCRDLEWYEDIDTNADLVFYYAAREICGRWPEAEAVIATNPHLAYYYAHGKWFVY